MACRGGVPAAQRRLWILGRVDAAGRLGELDRHRGDPAFRDNISANYLYLRFYKLCNLALIGFRIKLFIITYWNVE